MLQIVILNNGNHATYSKGSIGGLLLLGAGIFNVVTGICTEKALRSRSHLSYEEALSAFEMADADHNGILDSKNRIYYPTITNPTQLKQWLLSHQNKKTMMTKKHQLSEYQLLLHILLHENAVPLRKTLCNLLEVINHNF